MLDSLKAQYTSSYSISGKPHTRKQATLSEIKEEANVRTYPIYEILSAASIKVT